MAPLLTSVLDLLRTRGTGPRCLVCGRPVDDSDRQVRLRGDERAHRDCATYSMRRRREGEARLGYPRRR